MIDDAINEAEVTVVLISQGTSDQGYVQHAVRASHQLGKGLLAIYFHNIPDPQGKKAPIGNTQFGEIGIENGDRLFFWQRYPTYRWMIEDGPRNLRSWIDQAAKAAQGIRKP